MAKPTKRVDTVVVCEVLAFIQNKLDVMDELSLEQICSSNYTEAEIYGAKKLLHDTAVTAVHFSVRKKDGQKTKDLRDIIRVFKETDPDDVPTYVAKDLNKLPPVTFDHVDVTRLLKDITVLRADVTDIRRQLEQAERTSAELRLELTSLRATTAEPAVSVPTVSYVNTRRGGTKQRDTAPRASPPPSIVHNATHTVPSEANDPAPLRVRPCDVTDVPTPAQTAPSAQQRPAGGAPQKGTYAQVSRRRRHRPSCGVPASTVKATPSAPALADARATAKVVDKDGYILVENKKRRQRRNRNKRGTAPADTGLRAAEPMMQIYLSRLTLDTTRDDIWRHISQIGKGRFTEEAIEVQVTPLESRRSTNFRTFKLIVPAKYQRVFLSADFWPEGVVFRRYREAKPDNKIPN